MSHNDPIGDRIMRLGSLGQRSRIYLVTMNSRLRAIQVARVVHVHMNMLSRRVTVYRKVARHTGW